MRHFLLKWWIVAVALGALTIFWWRSSRVQGEQTPVALHDSRTNPAAVPQTTSLLPPPAVLAPAANLLAASTDPYGMPPPSPEQVRPVPAPPVITAQDHLLTQKAARDLVAQGITRLENEQRKAEQTGDTETAQRNRIRVARLRKRLAALAQPAAQLQEEK